MVFKQVKDNINNDVDNMNFYIICKMCGGKAKLITYTYDTYHYVEYVGEVLEEVNHARIECVDKKCDNIFEVEW